MEIKNAQSILEFCISHGISRTVFYELEKQKKAPRVMRIGRRVLISAEAAADWRRDMEHAKACDEGA